MRCLRRELIALVEVLEGVVVQEGMGWMDGSHMWVKVAAVDCPWQQRRLKHDDDGGGSQYLRWQGAR
jgi:hypothetical protein